MNYIHESTVGTYHPDPKSKIAWTIHDSRGTIDGGPSCDDCGACECSPCEDGCELDDHTPVIACSCSVHNPDAECVGLSYAYVCLDGGDSLCTDCIEGDEVEIVPCDC